MLTKSTLQKMKKEALIELVLSLQKQINESGYIYDTLKKVTPLVERNGKYRYRFYLQEKDYIKVVQDEITPSGYPLAGTEVVLLSGKLEELDSELYEQIKKCGWNREAVDYLIQLLFR